MYPEWLQITLQILGSILRFLGLAIFGLGFGWLALDVLKKSTAWQLQIAVFLGVAGLVIAMSVFTGLSALGAVAAAIGIAVLLWGLPKKEKKEAKKEDK